jgi:hypothetical protein
MVLFRFSVGIPIPIGNVKISQQIGISALILKFQVAKFNFYNKTFGFNKTFNWNGNY